MTWHLAFKSLSKTLLAISQNGHVDLEKTTHLGECQKSQHKLQLQNLIYIMCSWNFMESKSTSR